MAKQEETSKSAKILYRPIGLTSSILGGLLAGIIFKQVWRRATPGDQSDPPTALESEYDLKEIWNVPAFLDTRIRLLAG